MDECDERRGAGEASALRERMVREQIERRGVADPRVLAALRRVPRHRFVEAASPEDAHLDRPLPIGHGQTISQPYIVARMTEALRLEEGARVLEVGTGCGYQAAVLCALGAEVVTLEVVPALAAAARAHLAALGYERVRVELSDGFHGYPARAPYQGVLVACGAPRVPAALVDQLAPGGRLVIPVGEPGAVMDLLRLTREPTGVREEHLLKVRFVPLVSAASSS